MPKPTILNAFAMNTPSHLSPGLWRHPRDRAACYTDLRFWTELAQLLERGRFSALFPADSWGTYDTFGGSRDAALRQGLHVPVDDPLPVLPAMLAFGVTCSTSYENPSPWPGAFPPWTT